MDKEDTEDEEDMEEDINHGLKDSHLDPKWNLQRNVSEPWKKLPNPPEGNELPPSLQNLFLSMKKTETS